MKRRNTVRLLIASFLLLLTTGTLTVKSVHCVLISHDTNVTAINGLTVLSQDEADNCPICAFDFYPVILHSLKVLPDVTPFAYSPLTAALVAAPEKRTTPFFLLRAPPVA
jgi:hypothetical protein